MARYIDADKLKKALKELPEQERIEYMGIYDEINFQPTADVQEVKHGKWELKVEYKSCAYEATASCSECGWEWIGKEGECVGNHKCVFGAFVSGDKELAEQFVLDNARKRKLYDFCPSCGAKMDKE